MRINDYGKPEIQNEKTPHLSAGKRLAEETFQDNLIKNMTRNRKENEAAQGTGIIIKSNEHYMGPAENVTIHMPVGTRPKGAAETHLRRVAYKDCDKVKINVLEGYTLKLKQEDCAGGICVYAEVKYEDGKTEAYLLTGEALDSDEGNPIVKAACKMMEGKNL